MQPIDTDRAVFVQMTAADYFMEAWRMFTAETLPWGKFDREIVMIAMQEKTAKLYAEARRLAGITDECPGCDGCGRVDLEVHGWAPCSECDGHGWI